jgi:hypothetical protein
MRVRTWDRSGESDRDRDRFRFSANGKGRARQRSPVRRPGPQSQVQFDCSRITDLHRFSAHIRWMTERDQWTESLRRPKCGMTGSAELSQANGQAFHDGDEDVRVESLPDGFKVVELVYGSNFYCSACDCPVEP